MTMAKTLTVSRGLVGKLLTAKLLKMPSGNPPRTSVLIHGQTQFGPDKGLLLPGTKEPICTTAITTVVAARTLVPSA